MKITAIQTSNVLGARAIDVQMPKPVTLFVDRRLSARSITLPADRLNQLAEMARGA